MHDAEFTKFIQPKVVTRSIVYTTYHANRKKKEEREKSQNEKTAYITRHELPPPEPAMSSIDAESPVDYNQTFVVSKQKNEEEKHNKTVFIPQDPVQHQESFSYQNYKTYHKTEKSNQNESFSYKNYKNHHPQQNKQPIEKPKRTYTSLERELINKEALITQQRHEIERLVNEANKLKTNQTASNTKDSKPVASKPVSQAKPSNPAPVVQSKNQAVSSTSNTGGQIQSNPNTKSQNPTNQTIKK